MKKHILFSLIFVFLTVGFIFIQISNVEAATGTSTIMSAPQSNNHIGVFRDVPAIRLELNSTTSPAENLGTITITIATSTNATSTRVATSSFEWVGIVKDMNGNGLSDLPSPDILLATSTVSAIGATTTINIGAATTTPAIGIFFILFKTASSTYWTDNGAPEALDKIAQGIVVSIATNGVVASSTPATINTTTTQPFIADIHSEAPTSTKVSALYQSGAYKIFDTNGAGGVGEMGILNIYSTSTAGAAAITTTTMSSNGNFSQTSIGGTYLSSIWLDLNDAAQNATSSKVQYNLPALPSVNSIAGFTDRIIINTNKNLRGDQATLCSNYILNGSALVCGSSGQPFIEFFGNQMVIKNLSLTQGSSATLSIAGITDINSEAFPFTYSTTTLAVNIASVPTISSVSPNFGKVGDTITITGSNFTATGTVWFSGGFDPNTGPLQPIQATATAWSVTSITATVPTGAQSGPLTVVSSEGMMSDVMGASFFDVVGNVYIKLALATSSSPIATSTNMRIFIGNMTGEHIYYVGDNSTTTFDDTNKYYTIPNISSGGFTWAYDISGNYVSSAGSPLSPNTSTSSPQILIFATSTAKKVSGAITLGTSCAGDGQNKWVAVFAMPSGASSTAAGPGNAQPSFFKTNGSCTVAYNLALLSNGLYQVEAHLPPSATSTPLLDPTGVQVNISDASPTATVNFTFASATRKIYGRVVDANSSPFSAEKNNQLWIFSYQPIENGKSSASRANSSGYFTLYAGLGSYKIGIGGPGMPMGVERDIIVTASSTFDTTSTQVAITIKLAPPTSYISGYVKDGSGNAVSGVDISAWCEGSPAGGHSASDSQGFYKMYVPACSNYHVAGFSQNYGQLAEQTSVVVSPSSNPTVNFTLSSSNFVSVTGSVTQNSSALSGADVWLTQGSFGPSVGWAKTSSDGSFSVKIRTGLSGLYLHAAIMGQGEIANQLLNSGNAINADLNVGSISASVATIEIRLKPKDTFATGSVFIGVHSSLGGGFTNTKEGTGADYDIYRVRVPYSGSTLYTIDGGIQNFGPIPQTTTTVSGATSTVTIDLNLVAFYNVSGTVTSTVSGAVSDAFVWAGGSSGGGGTKTDASGNFSFKLRAGTYDIGVGQPGYSGSMLTGLNINTATSGLSLVLTQNSQTITGTVKYSGSSLTNARVWADNGSGGWAGATSEADGGFTLNVSSGSWTVRAIADGYQLTTPQVVTAPASGVILNMSAVSFNAKRKTQSVTPTQGGVIQTDDAKVEIPQGALGTSGTNVQMDITDTMSTPTKKGGRVVGNGKNIQATYASGDNQGQQITTLSQNVTIEIVLTKAQLESKSINTIAGAQKLKIGYDDPTATSWTEIPTTVILNPATSTLWSDLVSITLKGTTAHFSTFAPIDPIGENPPATPTGLSATAGVEKITLNWNASANATKYDIYRKSGNEYPYLAQTPNITYTDSWLLPTVTYYYKVTALNNNDNESAASEAVGAAALVYVGSGGGGYTPVTTITATTTVATTTQVIATTTTAITTTTVPIISAPAVSPIIPTIPVAVQKITKRLALGSRGDEVKTIQELLAQDKEVYPEGLTTGYFGSLTKKAVQKFQEKYGIAKKGDVGYGDVGPNTRLKLNQLLAGAAAPAAVPQLPAQAAEQAKIVQQIKTQLQTLQEQLAKLLSELVQKLQEQVQQKLGQ